MVSSKLNSIYEMLGGESVIADAVERLYFKILTDPELSLFFAYEKMEGINLHQTALLSMISGGPRTYYGRSLRCVHAPLIEQGLTDRHFDGVKRHVREVLEEQGHPDNLISEILILIEATRNDVLGGS